MVPRPGALSSVTGQPKRSPRRRTIDRPMPLPCGLRLVGADRTDRRRAAASSADMPMPLSRDHHAVLLDAHVDRALLGEGAGIAEQVAEHHRQHVRRRVQPRRCRVRNVQLDRLAGEQRPHLLDFLVARRRARRSPRSAARCRPRAPGSGRRRSPPPCRARRAGCAPANAARVGAVSGSAMHQVAGDADHGQRRAQLMAGVAGEIALALRRTRRRARPGRAARRRAAATSLPASSGRRSGAIALAFGSRGSQCATSLASQLTGVTRRFEVR